MGRVSISRKFGGVLVGCSLNTTWVHAGLGGEIGLCMSHLQADLDLSERFIELHFVMDATFVHLIFMTS